MKTFWSLDFRREVGSGNEGTDDEEEEKKLLNFVLFFSFPLFLLTFKLPEHVQRIFFSLGKRQFLWSFSSPLYFLFKSESVISERGRWGKIWAQKPKGQIVSKSSKMLKF